MDTQSTLKMKYRVSDEWCNAQFIASGQMPTSYQSTQLDMTQATPEERAAILRKLLQNRFGGMELDLTSGTHFDGEPTVAQIAADCILLADEKEAEWRKDLTEKAARAVETFQDRLKRKNPDLPSFALLEQSERERAAALGVDLASYHAALTAYRERQPEFARLTAEAKMRKIEVEAEIDERKRLAAEKAATEKAAWVEAHGSDRLRRACAAGHNCQRLYVLERATLEWPAFHVDFDDNASWKERSCPTTEALDLLDAIKSHGVDAEIVWLTDEPTDKNDEDTWGQEFDPCEAVVIRGYLGKYDLVKTV